MTTFMFYLESLQFFHLELWTLCTEWNKGVAEPDFTKCDMFLDQQLCLPWNNIVINQSDLKNKFIMFVKFRLIISVCCLYISVIHLLFPLILGITHG